MPNSPASIPWSTLGPPDVMHVDGSGPLPVIVFDIGATTFRSALCTPEGELIGLTKRPALSYRNFPAISPAQLQRSLVDLVVSETHRLQGTYPQSGVQSVGISMGAAVNSHTGLVLNSGPLWGPDCQPFDLQGQLSLRDPGLSWTVLNDITAALFFYATSLCPSEVQRITLLMIGSGIGCRTFDVASQEVPVDRVHGLQGEVGHVPITFAFGQDSLDLACDCGGLNHLNAFCSGRGIAAVIHELQRRYPRNVSLSHLAHRVLSSPDDARMSPLAEALGLGDPVAIQILESITLPIAETLIQLLTFDPLVERVVMSGGVLNALGGHYFEEVLKHLEHLGMYQVSERDSNYFRNRIVIGEPDDNAGLLGAASAVARSNSAEKQYVTHARSSVRQEMGARGQRWTVRASLPVEYWVVENDDLFDQTSVEFLKYLGDGGAGDRRHLMLADQNVLELHGRRLSDYFRAHRVECEIVGIAAAEQDKDFSSVLTCLEAMERFDLARRGQPVLAVGGGTLLDIVGLAAGLYRRGVPYIRVPTTLLAMVDASVGVKVGVNLSGQKNRIGTFFPPQAALLDLAFLRTLDRRQMRSGLAEILKMAITCDEELFHLLENHGRDFLVTGFVPSDPTLDIVRRAVGGMLNQLSPNLWESHLDRIVDFGHAFSPAIELSAHPVLAHGEAVAIDMAICTVVSHSRGQLSEPDLRRILRLMRELELPLSNPVCEAILVSQTLHEVTLHRGGRQRIPLPEAIGRTKFCDSLSVTEVMSAVDFLERAQS